jgi:alpha-glucosidase
MSNTRFILHLLISFTLLMGSTHTYGQSKTGTRNQTVPNNQLAVSSPNKHLKAPLHQHATEGWWYLTLHAVNKDTAQVVILAIKLGLMLDEQTFGNNLTLAKRSKDKAITASYQAIHGKRLQRQNQANEVTFHFVNNTNSPFILVVRLYNDGLTFRYALPTKKGDHQVKEELTTYLVNDGDARWLEPWSTANEGVYTHQKNTFAQRDWCYPGLFEAGQANCWYLIHEADLNETYCGTKLSNQQAPNQYQLVFPDPGDGNGLGAVQPTITTPWASPWRVVMVGSLATLVESTLVEDVSTPTSLTNTAWIKPGKASWNYWSNNHGTRDYKVVCAFADLAAEMQWPYTLLDWEWDAMGNGGNLDDALRYIHAKGIKPLMWYNSGGPHTGVSATPRDRLLTHESRLEEFAKLKRQGVYGIKVDFFDSEKQDMIRYYLDILKDAAPFELMVYFHGCLVPRGWSRTYPHLMTLESVKGAEWYNNIPDFTWEAPAHNCVMPFTRNVVGAMDYTPVTFTNSQHPHTTSYGHELALSVVFESGIQHMADRPDGYRSLPEPVRNFLKVVPNVWDDTKLISGYPGRDLTLMRQRNDTFYLGGINGENWPKHTTLKLDFLPVGKTYTLQLMADGEHDKSFSISERRVDCTSTLDVRMLRRGGFAAMLCEDKALIETAQTNRVTLTLKNGKAADIPKGPYEPTWASIEKSYQVPEWSLKRNKTYSWKSAVGCQSMATAFMARAPGNRKRKASSDSLKKAQPSMP